MPPPIKASSLTREEARAYVDRWRSVHEVEVAELREQSPEDNLRQLAALMTMGRVLGWLKELEAQSESGSDNWLRLRRVISG